MKFVLLFALGAAAVVARAGPAVAPTAGDLNVNSRYMVEAVDLLPENQYALSSSAKTEITRLIGENLNVDALNRLAGRLAEELRASAVTFRVVRGEEPSSVRVEFNIDRRPTRFEAAITQFSFVSPEGWSGTAQATATLGPNVLTLAALTNADDEVERYSGIRARYDRLALGPDWLRLGFEFDAFREDARDSTISSLGAGVLGSRTNFEPSATFVLAKPLTLTVGMSFENVEPSVSAASGEAVNSLAETLRYNRHWDDSDAYAQELDAAYSLRAATRLLGSDGVYTRHLVKARYKFRHQPQTIEVAVMAGWIYGQAPLFERFVLGNSETLRGWDQYELDPAGGNRMAHASVTYGYHIMRVFYDTGAIWDRGQRPVERHSAGAGITTGLGLFGKDALLLAVAFPIGQGRTLPVFVAGMNF